MTIIQLEYLLAVANYGTFSTAAEHCFVTQPSLSMQISNLEEELGVTLLDRSSKPIVPTEIGHIVLECAKDTIAAFYRIKEQINNQRGEISGKLRLGVIPTISPFLMPRFVPEFVKRCPNVDLEVRDLFTADITDALNHNMIDVAILSGGYQVKIKETKLFKDKLYMYVSPKNKLFNRNEVSIEEVEIKDLLMLSEGNCLRNQALKIMCIKKQQLGSLFNFANSSLETLMHTVDATSAVTVIPGMAIDFIPEEKRKQIKPFGNVDAHRKISLAVSRTYVKESLVNAIKESAIAVSKMGVAEFLI